ncbi:MAG: ABC transporter ATP-binding protein, partial [Mangrovibacterium sp.]|nr:ABC transporter ATP-binding protein [Mangrovibacterium sp.]
MSAEIEIKHLQKKYPNGVEALKGIDLEIGKGRLFALLGPNGAGKSTLVKIMTSLIRKDSGEFRIGGMNPEDHFARLRQYMGIASQENELDPGEKTETLLRFQARLFGMSKKLAAERADELIRLFRLSAERAKKVSALSGGNKRRLHCALALVHHPRILFLDEPTVGMDPLARETFWSVITDLNEQENITVLLTTQYLEEADKYASDIALIMEGRI